MVGLERLRQRGLRRFHRTAVVDNGVVGRSRLEEEQEAGLVGMVKLWIEGCIVRGWRGCLRDRGEGCIDCCPPFFAVYF